MMRKRSLPKTPDSEGRQLVADALGLDIADVTVEPQEEIYSVYLSGNLDAQANYKKCNPYGNSDRPGKYDFRDRLLVRWTGKSVKPA